jgi:signal peptidase I
VFTLVLGTGLGLALAGRLRRALTWLVAGVIAIALVNVTPWATYLFVAIHVGAAVDAYLVGRRSEQPLRWLARGPAALVVAELAISFTMRSFVVEAFRVPSSSMYPTLHIGDHFFIDKLSLHWHSPERGDLVVFGYPCDPARDYLERVAAIGGDTIEIRCSVLYVNSHAVPATLVDADVTYEDYYDREGWFPKHASRYSEVHDGHGYDTYSDPERPARDRVTDRSDGDARDFPRLVATATAPNCANSEDTAPHIDQVLGKLVTTVPPESAKACEPQLHYVVPPDHVFTLGDNRYNSNDSRIWGSVPTSLVKGRITGIYYSSGAHGLELGRIGRVK